MNNRYLEKVAQLFSEEGSDLDNIRWSLAVTPTGYEVIDEGQLDNASEILSRRPNLGDIGENALLDGSDAFALGLILADSEREKVASDMSEDARHGALIGSIYGTGLGGAAGLVPGYAGSGRLRLLNHIAGALAGGTAGAVMGGTAGAVSGQLVDKAIAFLEAMAARG